MEVKRKRLSREEKKAKAVVDLINQMFIYETVRDF